MKDQATSSMTGTKSLATGQKPGSAVDVDIRVNNINIQINPNQDTLKNTERIMTEGD